MADHGDMLHIHYLDTCPICTGALPWQVAQIFPHWLALLILPPGKLGGAVCRCGLYLLALPLDVLVIGDRRTLPALADMPYEGLARAA